MRGRRAGWKGEGTARSAGHFESAVRRGAGAGSLGGECSCNVFQVPAKRTATSVLMVSCVLRSVRLCPTDVRSARARRRATSAPRTRLVNRSTSGAIGMDVAREPARKEWIVRPTSSAIRGRTAPTLVAAGSGPATVRATNAKTGSSVNQMTRWQVRAAVGRSSAQKEQHVRPIRNASKMGCAARALVRSIRIVNVGCASLDAARRSSLCVSVGPPKWARQ